MKKLLVILLLLFPVHGAWADDNEDVYMYCSGKYDLTILKLIQIDEKCEKGDTSACKLDKKFDKCLKKERKRLTKERRQREKIWAEERCSRQAMKSKTNKAADRFYKACMKSAGF